MTDWKEIPGYEDYLVSNEGEVWSYKKNKLLSPGISSAGYATVVLYRDGVTKSFTVHRLVMMAFVRVSDKPVNHINFDKLDNRLENLEYTTMAENSQWTAINKRNNAASGEKHWKSKLTWDRVRQLRAEYPDTELTLTELAAKYGVSAATVSAIVNNKSWVE